ncbi:MAG TPA: DUF6079 family protein [Longimicrobiaceae bacterium]|nr:DUF6079 family protein [Longimicrobiaceae bacterium]
MKYGETMNFAPIETVVQLREADDPTGGKRLVADYVIGDAMAERLRSSVLPVLDPSGSRGRGLLVVGNYGTGKSHLLAVISAIAELHDAPRFLRHEDVAREAGPIAGRYAVVRAELGATTMTLRDFVCTELETRLGEIGVSFTFPSSDQIGGHKREFAVLIEALQQKFPDKGLFLVVDELLDYLRTRSDRELAFDLNFLRELGEIAAFLPFRFIAGVQEALFNNPRFQFVSDALERVADRFDEVRIAGGDLDHVVAARLLSRTDEQLRSVRKHLASFTRYFPDLGERMEHYARLFPVHPAYLAELATISAVEKREVFRTLSGSLTALLEQEVPVTTPGVLSYDDFWSIAREGGQISMRPGRRAVVEAVTTAEGRLAQGISRECHRSCSTRIIRALGVRCLARDRENVTAISATRLRDELLLFDPGVTALGGEPPDDLLGFVDAAIEGMRQALAGQFVTESPEGGFYLDLQKTEDYEAVLEHRASSIGADGVDRAYFQTLLDLLIQPRMRTSAGPSVEVECRVPWPGHGISRPGVIVCGRPEPAASPGRVRIILLPPREPPDQGGPADVFITTSIDADLRRVLKRSAAAADLAAASSGDRAEAFERVARDAHYQATNRLRRGIGAGARIGRVGRQTSISQLLEGHRTRELLDLEPDERASPRDLLLLCVGLSMLPFWEEEAPEYPRFRARLKPESVAAAASEAMRELVGAAPTDRGHAVLVGLELIRDGEPSPFGSRYARHLLGLLARQGAGRVLNRSALLTNTPSGERFAPGLYSLEPEFLVVLAASLMQADSAAIWVQDRLFGADELREMVEIPIARLTWFGCLAPPRVWPDRATQTLLELGRPAPAADAIGVSIEILVPELGRTLGIAESLNGEFGKGAIDEDRSDLVDYLGRATSALPDDHPWNREFTRVKRALAPSISSEFSDKDYRSLEHLKQTYIRIYRRLHRRARLDRAGDAVKSALLANARMQALLAFSGMPGFPYRAFTDLRDRVAAARSCFGLTGEDVIRSHLCPHCSFDPASESDVPIALLMDRSERDLADLHGRWIESLRTALRENGAHVGLALLPSDLQAEIDEFLSTGEPPSPLGEDLLTGIRQVLHGLEPVELDADLLCERLRGRNPGSPDEVRRRFDHLLHEVVSGRRSERVRILVV